MNVYNSRIILSQLSESEIQLLTKDFLDIKINQKRNLTFGKDVPGNYTNQLYLSHIHLRPEQTSSDYSNWLLQFEQGAIPTSNRYLYYAEHQEKHGFLFIAVSFDKAHESWKRTTLIEKLTNKAKIFCIEGYQTYLEEHFEVQE